MAVSVLSSGMEAPFIPRSISKSHRSGALDACLAHDHAELGKCIKKATDGINRFNGGRNDTIHGRADGIELFLTLGGGARQSRMTCNKGPIWAQNMA